VVLTKTLGADDSILRGFRLPLLLLAASFLAPVEIAHSQGRDDDAELDTPSNQLLLVKLKDPPNSAAVQTLKKKIEGKIESNPDITWVVFDFQLKGDWDDYEAGNDLATFIDESLRRTTTIAYVQEGHEAVGAAVLPLVACREIAVGPGARIGAGGRPAPLIDQAVREQFAKRARDLAGRRNRSGVLAELMIHKAEQNIYRLKRKNNDGGDTRRFAFWRQKDLNESDKSERMRKYFPEELFLEKGQYLTLDGTNAGGEFKWYGWVRYTGVSNEDDNLSALLTTMQINLAQSDIVDLEGGRRTDVADWVERIAKVLRQPAIQFLLILLGILGLLIEIKMFGTIVPGILGVLCFTLFFAGGMIPIPDKPPTSSWAEVTMFAIGLGLILVEFLVVPGLAFFALGGAAACGTAIVLAMVGGGESTGNSTVGGEVWDAVGTLAYAFGGSAVVFMLILRFLPQSKFFAKGIVSQATIEGVPSADSAESSAGVLAAYVGKVGVADTPLRPAGKIHLETGKVLDVVADGEFIERGEKVVVQSCESTRIVVGRVPISEDPDPDVV